MEYERQTTGHSLIDEVVDAWTRLKYFDPQASASMFLPGASDLNAAILGALDDSALLSLLKVLRGRITRLADSGDRARFARSGTRDPLMYHDVRGITEKSG